MKTITELAWSDAAASKLLSPEQLTALAEYKSRARADSPYSGDAAGYPNGFHVADTSHDEFAARFTAYCPTGWKIVALFWGRGVGDLNVGSFRIGQYKVRSHDPESPIFLCPQ